MSQRDYYHILGVDKNASPKKIKAAYRELAFQYHPDRNKENPQAAEEMKHINEAYAVLSDPTKRRDYDHLKQQYGSSAYSQFRNNYSNQDIFSGSDINHIFEEMSKAFGFRNFDDIFKEFYGKEYRTFQFRRPGFFAGGFIFSGSFGKERRQQPQFPLPNRLKKLSRLLLKTIGGVELQENGANIKDVIHLTPEQARQGGPFAYFFRKKSKKLVVKIPPGVREGQRIRLAGMGEGGKGGGTSGDLYLEVKIKQPLLQKIKGMITDLRK
ncbi:MAG: J domain-containing protein [Desulfobacterales bacterium]|nr:MAG: J domain-containing protein [Desulfobacterales bacterium]UCD89460.1 MAG: J domain-containing protein [Desulfobacterales bacterium]